MPTPFTLTAADGSGADVIADIITTPEGGGVRLSLGLSLGAVRAPVSPPAGGEEVFSAPGSFTHTASYTGDALVECWGAGRAGNGGGPGFPGSGGNGGWYVSHTIAIVSGQPYAVVVGTGGTSPASPTGGDSTFDGFTVIAPGGGSFSFATGNGTQNSGGVGQNGVGAVGGGGGSGATATSTGANGSGTTGGILAGAGSGGDGGSAAAGTAGGSPGGGGGGGAPLHLGGAGGAGKVRISWPAA